MDAYREFKHAYRGYFVDKPNYLCTEDLQVTVNFKELDGFENLVILAYNLLLACPEPGLGYLKVLHRYEKLMKKNRVQRKTTNPVKFATICYVLHQYCVKILRSPWRNDYLIIKDYSGFYQYTLYEHLAPSIIEELLHLIGFEYEQDLSMFQFNPTMNQQVVQSITEAGIGFFLSYVHCMISHDAHFKRKVATMNYSLQQSRISKHSPMQSYNSEQPSTSRMNRTKNITRNVDSSSMNNFNTSLENLREKRLRNSEFSNPYPVDIRTQSRSSNHGQEKAATNLMMNDIYDSHRNPLNLSNSNQSAGASNSVSVRQGSPHSDYMDDQSLYCGADSKLYNSNGDNNRNLSSENSLNEVLYPPNIVGQSTHSLDVQMENFRFDEGSRQKDYAMATAAHGIEASPNKHASSLSANYVKFYPRRGSPDGEITTEGHYDHRAPERQNKISSSRIYPRHSTEQRHIYHDIDDNTHYGQ
uniref:uncharacterized protein LOC120345913 n=1 Tax=Styela clava TaxID=7725 RepID=UPI00193926D6|nr:uncharacterized protein LOC120345913 [Styela clava]